jgi:chromate transport protein ChrA
MEPKWMLAIGLEAAFWIMLAAFLVLRYRYGMESVTRLFVIGVVIDTAGLLGLAVWDFAANGNVSTYTIFIAAILVYAFTAGKRDMKRLDAWMERRMAPRRARTAAGRPCPDRT